MSSRKKNKKVGKRRTLKKYCPRYARLPDTTVYGKNKAYLFKKIPTENKQLLFPKKGKGGKEAFKIARKYLYGDLNPDKNFITFVNTHADPYQDKIHFDTKNINFIDTTPYFKIKSMEQQMVRMMGNLFRDPNYKQTKGISTIGSSEAIYVSTILHKFKWEERHKQEANKKLNMIFSFNTHINWDKAARWNYINAKKIPAKHLNYIFGAKEVESRINKNTICITCTVGSTRTAQNDRVEEINTFLKKYYKETGIFVPIHIDAAIGGFITPFMNPKLKWAMDLEHVKSINVSFHKYGGTYPGMGMLVVKSDYSLPNKFRFVFNIEKTASVALATHGAAPHASIGQKIAQNDQNRFKGEADDWYINFSKPSSQIVTAFYLIQKLGFDGYKKRIENCVKTSKILSNYINSLKSKTGKKIFLQVNEPYYPVIAFVLNDTTFPLKQILSHLEKKDGYAIPAYQMGNISDIVMRMVFKPNVSHTEAYRLRDALKSAIQHIY